MASKVMVFIDVGNQFYCISKRWPGKKLDYKKYLDRAATFGNVDRALAYGTKIDDNANSFITALHHMGFEPQYRLVEKNSWYDWDVGIAMDIVRLIDKTDTVIIGNSNKSIAPVISWAKKQGIRVIVMGCGINKELKEECDQWIEIDESMLEQEHEHKVAKATE
jgi:uncharacterized LabA/DUF88 family protein